MKINYVKSKLFGTNVTHLKTTHSLNAVYNRISIGNVNKSKLTLFMKFRNF